jgi:hypothetical protein
MTPARTGSAVGEASGSRAPPRSGPRSLSNDRIFVQVAARRTFVFTLNHDRRADSGDCASIRRPLPGTTSTAPTTNNERIYFAASVLPPRMGRSRLSGRSHFRPVAGCFLATPARRHRSRSLLTWYSFFAPNGFPIPLDQRKYTGPP